MLHQKNMHQNMHIPASDNVHYTDIFVDAVLLFTKINSGGQAVVPWRRGHPNFDVLLYSNITTSTMAIYHNVLMVNPIMC